MSHALLLRLFLSPYFSISVAMHYLKTYSDSIGISHYLCWRMKGMRAEEVEGYWPQICHLLITYPTQSNALESFVLQRAEESTHSAMLTFWFMQAALRDLTPTRETNPRPFLICQRVLHRCHEILFGDPAETSRSPYRSLSQSPSASTTALSSAGALVNALRPDPTSRVKVRVNQHALAAFVGMGVVIGAQGMPELGGMVGGWAVMQGRKPRDEDKEGRERVENMEEGADVPKGRVLDKEKEKERKSNEVDSEEEQDQDNQMVPRTSINASPRILSTPSLQQTAKHPAQTVPNLAPSPSNSRYSTERPFGIRTPPSEAVDPFSQEPEDPPGPSRLSTGISSRLPHQPYHSTPDLSHGKSRAPRPNGLPPTAEELLAGYNIDTQRQMLRAHYCRSQIRFLLLLEDISNRLLVVPKPARVPALRAELTSLNHNLPAEICMPLWCAADHSHEEGGETAQSTPLKARPDRQHASRKKGHSRVVRISPGDSVVLNSAERAPFLLHVEIMDGDLDFDPLRRENRELLKRIAVQTDLKRRKREMKGLGLDSGREGYRRPSVGLGFEDFGGGMMAAEENERPRILSTASTSQQRQAQVEPEESEEMDLVEQLYGAKISVRDTLPELTDALPLPSAPKNKALDVAAWDRGTESNSRRASYTPQFAETSTMPNTPTIPDTTSATDLSMLGMTPSPNPSAPHTPNHLHAGSQTPGRIISLEDYSERMRTAAVMLAQLNASLVPATPEQSGGGNAGRLSWIPGTGWILGTSTPAGASAQTANPVVEQVPMQGAGGKLKLAAAQAEAIRSRIMEEMMALEEERVARMTERPEGSEMKVPEAAEGATAEDEGIVRRELNKADPSAAVFKESWTAKKSRIRESSPWGHLANWDVISVIVKTGTDLRQEQLATQLIERFGKIFKEEKCDCWVRSFRILITGEQSGLVETITDAVSVHSIKKGEYARRISEGGPIGQVSLMDHFVNTYGKPDSGRFARAQRAFIRSLAAYSIVTYLLQIKDRHNGNILVDREGHLIHIDFGFMLSNSPGGNMGFEAAPFKMPLEYVDIMGGLDSAGWVYFKRLFKEGFEAARKHSDSLITMVELMQKNSKLDCFVLFGDQTAHHLRERFALSLTTAAVDAHLERLIVNSTGSNYTRLYDTFQYYSQGVL